MKRQKKHNANLMMIDYLISNTIAQNVVLILMAIQKLFVTRLNREYLKETSKYDVKRMVDYECINF